MTMETDFALYRTFMDVYSIDAESYRRYDVKRGLRNADGTGVVAGLTKISNVHGYVMDEGEKAPDEGSLTYRGHSIGDLVDDARANGYFGFERVAHLLLAGTLPSDEAAERFNEVIAECRDLPTGFIHGVIANQPPRNIMNQLIRCTIALYPYDEHEESIGSPEAAPHEIHAALSLLGRMPRLAVLGYYAAQLVYAGGSMIVHPVIPGQSTAETILSMLRPDRSFTREEAELLDVMLMLHAEHGGGNNSTFTCRCLTSSGTDPYSAYAGALASLKGPRHGGANIRALEQQEDMLACLGEHPGEGAVADYLRGALAKERFDGSGLVYGMGHAVYTKSDPRAVLCKKYAASVVAGTEFQAQFELAQMVERLTPEIIAGAKGNAKAICANIDLYSGLVYRALGIPKELFTPLFACARMAGWAAHRFEEIYGASRIIRPAYKYIAGE